MKRNSMVSEMIKNLLVVGAGSFLGGAGRYLISQAMKGVGKGFPWATLAVNLAGGFLIGLLWGLFSKDGTEGGDWALFLTVGLCGVCSYQCRCRYCPGCMGIHPGSIDVRFTGVTQTLTVLEDCRGFASEYVRKQTFLGSLNL